MDNTKNAKVSLKDLIKSMLKTKQPKTINICSVPNLKLEIADEVLNEVLRECFEEKDFEGMRIVVKMKEGLKELYNNKS